MKHLAGRLCPWDGPLFTLAKGDWRLRGKLAGLTASEEATLTTRFLAPLAQLEAALLGASDNLDTAIAGPWTANPNEVSARSRLYDQWRRDMAAFLGFAPGPSLGGGGPVLFSRC